MIRKWWAQRGFSTFLMAWKLLNANEKQRLFVNRVQTEGLMFLHHVGRIRAFFLEIDSTVLLWVLIKHRDCSEMAKELRTPQSQGLSSCQRKCPLKKKLSGFGFVFLFCFFVFF